MTRLFGTDGIRGVANLDLRPSLAFALGRATAHQVVHAGGALIVGCDTRRSGDMFVAAITAGATSMGADVHQVGIVPTPALAFLAADGDFAAGIMVSASHNPAEDNGLKVLDPRGLKLDDDVEDELEAAVLRADELPGVAPGSIGRAFDAGHLLARYVAHRRGLAEGVDASGLHVVLDTANGAAFRVAPEILRATGATVTVIHDAPDGDNINRASGATAPASLADAVRAAGADIGFALDGDADRCVAVDGAGNLVDGDQVLGILALERLARGALDHGQPRRVGALERRPPGGGRGRGRAHRADPGRGQAHPRGDAGLGRRPRRREERARDHPRAHHVGRRDRDRDRAPAGHDDRGCRDRAARRGRAAPAPAAARDPGPPPRPVGGRRRPRGVDRRRGTAPRAARPGPRASLGHRTRPAGHGRGPRRRARLRARRRHRGARRRPTTLASRGGAACSSPRRSPRRMCGIVGYTGPREAGPILIEGLRRLEYRGYDSAGIALVDEQGDLFVEKKAGKLANLQTAIADRTPHAAIGLAHTRWATHGRPNDLNAHPHQDCTGDITVIHNGIIENFRDLRDGLEARVTPSRPRPTPRRSPTSSRRPTRATSPTPSGRPCASSRAPTRWS